MQRSPLRAPVASAFCAVVLAGCLAGCAADTPHPGSADPDADPDAHGAGFAEVLARPAPTADYAWYPETVSDALPSVRYTGDMHASELVAVGRLTGWTAGEPAHPSLERIDLTFAVDEVVDSLGDLTMLEGGTVTVRVGIDGTADRDRVAEELLALDDVVLFLNHVGPEQWPPPEWVVVFDDAFLGDVHDGAAITWPVAEAIAANNPADSHPAVDASTLDELRVAATRERTVELPLNG
ncbi:hypothetical protein [Promicromonospora sp. NPDC059942]|uniref:hypothetical protein n=1 Tax=Promicromonospora sp. NPDC059942 TaxID=3347009 RepID=UPI0036569A7C